MSFDHSARPRQRDRARQPCAGGVDTIGDGRHDALRVLHVMTRMQPDGTERQLVGMLRAGHGRLWNATLCVLESGFDLTRQIAEAGVPVMELAPRARWAGWYARQLRRFVRSGQFDVVHSSLWGANAFTRLAAAGGRRPAIVVSERRVEDFRSARRRRLDRALRHVTDAYIGNSEAVGSFITVAHDVARERVHVVPNGIDTEVFLPHEQSRWDPAAGPRRIGAVGRLAHQKGFDILIAALPAVLDHHDVDVTIIGEGALRRDLEHQARGLPVSFMGRLDSPSEVADFLRSLDLFVMPSRYEGLPNAVLEAVACGVRVVATDAPGMRAALGSAPLVPAEDPHALAGAITSALSGAGEKPRARIPDFDDVAQAHAQVFRLAYERHANARAGATTGAR